MCTYCDLSMKCVGPYKSLCPASLYLMFTKIVLTGSGHEKQKDQPPLLYSQAVTMIDSGTEKQIHMLIKITNWPSFSAPRMKTAYTAVRLDDDLLETDWKRQLIQTGPLPVSASKAPSACHSLVYLEAMNCQFTSEKGKSK